MHTTHTNYPQRNNFFIQDFDWSPLSCNIPNNLRGRELTCLLFLKRGDLYDYFVAAIFIAMVSCSRLIWITNFSDHRRVRTANLFHKKSLPNPPDHKA